MKKTIAAALLIACLFISLLPTSIVAESTHSTLSGTITLPDNEKAPEGGVKVTLTVSTDNLTAGTDDDVYVSRELTIAKGNGNISYSIAVPKSSNKDAKYTISYKTDSKYAPFGWYSKDGTTPIKEKQTQVDLNSGNAGNVNITLLEGRVISGKIILGNQETAPLNDLVYTINAVQEGKNKDSSDDDIKVTGKVTVEKGKKEKDWSLIVPMNQPGNGYKVFYGYENGGYMEEGYFSSDGTSRSEGKVTLIDVSNTVTGINLTTLPFTNITGKVSLPGNDKAPKNGLDIILTAKNYGSPTSAKDDFQFMKTIKIPENSGFVDYDFTVPVKSTGYVISYTVASGKGYVKEGYYSTKNTTSKESNATMIIAGFKAVTDINMDILKEITATPTPTATPTLTAAPTPTPTPKVTPTPKLSPIPKGTDKYDLNEDGFVNIKDLFVLARVIVDRQKDAKKDELQKQYKDWQISNEDLKMLREALKPYYNNRYQLKLFNGSTTFLKLFNLDLKDFEWDFDFDCGDRDKNSSTGKNNKNNTNDNTNKNNNKNKPGK